MEISKGIAIALMILISLSLILTAVAFGVNSIALTVVTFLLLIATTALQAYATWNEFK